MAASKLCVELAGQPDVVIVLGNSLRRLHRLHIRAEGALDDRN
jgi:hypothetical protein